MTSLAANSTSCPWTGTIFRSPFLPKKRYPLIKGSINRQRHRSCFQPSGFGRCLRLMELMKSFAVISSRSPWADKLALFSSETSFENAGRFLSSRTATACCPGQTSNNASGIETQPSDRTKCPSSVSKICSASIPFRNAFSTISPHIPSNSALS